MCTGIFEYMKANFSYSPTMDMTPEVLAFFSDLVRVRDNVTLYIFNYSLTVCGVCMYVCVCVRLKQLNCSGIL